MRIVVAVACLLVAGCESLTQTANFNMGRCDGLGMRVRSTPDLRQGVDTCTTALQSLEEAFPDNAMRRVSLIQARALHRIAAKDYTGALADLDLADQAALGMDMYYARSLGLNSQFIRALALVNNGSKEEAISLAAQGYARRPYSRDAGLAALSVMSLDAGHEVIDETLATLSRVHPNFSDLPFKYYFETGRFEQALAIADGLRPHVIPDAQTYDMRRSLQQAERVRMTEAVFWVDVDGRRAYALAALGRKDEAMAVLAGAADRINAAKVTPVPLPAKPSERDKTLRIVQTEVNLEIEAEARPLVAYWTKLVEARLAVNDGDRAKSLAIMKDVKMASPTLVAFEYEEEVEEEPTDAEMNALLRAAAVGFPVPSAKLMFDFLLHPEFADTFEQNSDPLAGLFMSEDDKARGGCSEGLTSEGWQTICFKSLKSAPNTSEEYALLRAADRAIAQGASSFVIQRRMDIRYSVTSTYYGTPMGTYDDGYETRIDVKFFKSGEQGGDCGRCFDAAKVRADLGPIYRPAAVKP